MSTTAVRSDSSSAISTPMRTSRSRPYLRKMDDDVVLCPLPMNPEESITSLGRQCQSVINDFSSAARTTAGLPFEPWVSSSYYPESGPGLQLLGFSSATNGPIGLKNLYDTAKEGAHADEIGDTRGVGYKIIDGGVSASQAAFGFDYAVFRVANIGQCVTAGRDPAEAARWGNLSNQTGLWGNYLGAALYGGLFLSEACVAGESFVFKRKLDKKADKVDYLKKRLHADADSLLEKEKKRIAKTQPDLRDQLETIDFLARQNIADRAEAVALEQQKGVLDGHIKFMREHKMCAKDFSPNPEQLKNIVRQRMSESDLQKLGTEILVQKLKEKKVTKMTRRLGAEAVKELEKPADQIELAKIEVSHSKERWKHVGKSILYGLGAAGMIGLCFVTGGAGVLVLSLLLAAVFSVELYMSYQRMQDLRKDHTKPPGQYDMLFPIGSIGLSCASIVTAVVLSIIFPVPFAPLVLTALLTALWMGTSGLHVTYIQERRENYIQHLLDKTEPLQMHEFAYFVKYAKSEQIEQSLETALNKLNLSDSRGISEFLAENNDTTTEMTRARYQEAVDKWIIESQKLSLEGLCRDLQTEFGESFAT